MKLAVVAHRFAMNVLGELLWSQLLRILGQETVAGTPRREDMEEVLIQLCVSISLCCIPRMAADRSAVLSVPRQQQQPYA